MVKRGRKQNVLSDSESSGVEAPTKIQKVELTKKGLAVVDQHCHVQKEVHVYQVGSDIYDVMLNQTDLSYGVYGHNKYYQIQMLEWDKKKKWAVWTRWGRVGEVIQRNMNLKEFTTKDAAIEFFCKKYFDKTKNEWAERSNFKAVKGKYIPIEISYEVSDNGSDGRSDKELDEEDDVPESSLAGPLQDLVKTIFDTSTFEKTLIGMEYDIRKMPLGKLSKSQIKRGYEILTKIQTLIQQGKFGEQLTKYCNNFYTMIPHDFGRKKVPVIRTLDIVQKKLELLQTLGDIEIATKLLKESKKIKSANPLDLRYSSLHATIAPVDSSSEEYQLVEKMVLNTHGSTHDRYTLEVKHLFSIDRRGESARFKPFESLHNHKLLWHGSRVSNMVGIVSQGLRIAPPEAPATGYMFGKGVYFADMVSKSANYCIDSEDFTEGFLLLCEVALGDIACKTQADYMKKLPAGKHSVEGLGKSVPNPQDDVTLENGCVAHCGKEIDRTDELLKLDPKPALQYNEYIVYDVNQLKIRYMVWAKFNFKY